jgi:hypothetical protein
VRGRDPIDLLAPELSHLARPPQEEVQQERRVVLPGREAPELVDGRIR